MNLAPTPLAFRGRIAVLQILLGGMVLCVLAGYYKIQVIENDHYEALAEKYRVKKRRIKAARGLIFDRNEQLITSNMPTYNLVLQRDEMEEGWSELRPKIATFLKISENELESCYKNKSGVFSQPILLRENVPFAFATRVRRNQLRFPGLTIETTEKRYYGDGSLFAHVLGYVGEVSPEMMASDSKLRMGDQIGRSGVERFYNDLLKGKDGQREILTDNRGLHRDQIVTEIPTPGEDLYLTLDTSLQKLALQALEGHKGSVVMMDIHTGEILVSVSSPSYDLNLFSGGIDRVEWDRLNNSPEEPFLNRPAQGTYAPGSVFKIVTALAALKYNKITPQTRYFCNGSYDFYGHIFRCHKKGGHGSVDLEKAIQMSCNVYFYQVARDLDISKLAEVASSLSLGTLTGIDLHGERTGLMPSPEWKKARYKQPWYPGETLSVAIGQGNLQITPLQLVRVIAAVATEGTLPKPHLIYKTTGKSNPEAWIPDSQVVLELPSEYYAPVKSAMWNVVNQPGGTGYRARVEGYDVCGKTGTAQLINFKHENQDKDDSVKNAWFAGFAPLNQPEVALVVLVEQAGAGGANAAPIAKLLFQAYRDREKRLAPI